ncbi:MAG: phenylacetate--CoA ligase [Clostridiales bacterium]|jgi:phenylacetate-CoA ligase|nr:phenylacetate--CoA ligase [Clostridiales bacterium]
MRYYQKKLECISRGELRSLQSERLVKLVRYMYDNVAPYRKKMVDIGIEPGDIKDIDDLKLLPFTEKTDLRDNYPFGLLAKPMKDISRFHGSSGTSGKLTVVGYTKSDLKIWAQVMARSLVMAGADKDSVVHVAYGYGLFTGGFGAHMGAELIGSTITPASSGNTARQIMLIRDFNAKILCCTPSYALYIAEEMQKLGMSPEDIPLKAGVFGAEPWTNEMRDEIEKRLGITALDVYGLSEISGPGVSMECTVKNGMHIWEDHFVPEVLGADLKPLKYGEKGELVFTTITKDGMPLIRYRTRDICTLYDGKCACGRTHVRMSKIVGRTDDMLIIRGINVFPSQLEAALIRCGNIVTPNYQIIVDREGLLDRLSVKVEMSDEAFTDTVSEVERIRKAIEKEIHDALGIGAKIILCEPRSIVRSEGKAVRIIDNRKKY